VTLGRIDVQGAGTLMRIQIGNLIVADERSWSNAPVVSVAVDLTVDVRHGDRGEYGPAGGRLGVLPLAVCIDYRRSKTSGRAFWRTSMGGDEREPYRPDLASDGARALASVEGLRRRLRMTELGLGSTTVLALILAYFFSVEHGLFGRREPARLRFETEAGVCWRGQSCDPEAARAALVIAACSRADGSWSDAGACSQLGDVRLDGGR
jgi:hypothetical protein